MNPIQEVLASIRLVFTGETTCRLCFVTAPIVWIFGCFFLGVNAITIFAKHESSFTTTFLVCFGIFMMLCGIFTASNTIHICIQLPTSPIALKIQKIGQMVVLSIYFLLVLFSWSLGGSSISKGDTVLDFNSDYTKFQWQELTFLGLFFITTLSCMLS